MNLKSEANIESAYESELGLALVFLQILNRINTNYDLISFEDFYIPEVTESINLQVTFTAYFF